VEESRHQKWSALPLRNASAHPGAVKGSFAARLPPQAFQILRMLLNGLGNWSPARTCIGLVVCRHLCLILDTELNNANQANSVMS